MTSAFDSPCSISGISKPMRSRSVGTVSMWEYRPGCGVLRAGDADEHGYADGVFVHDHLVEDVVVAELVSVFAGEYDDGVFGESEFV